MRIYLDYNSTSLMDKPVADLLFKLINERRAYNPSSIHEDGRNARAMIENARKHLAQALGFDLYKDDIQVIFTASGTEANNLIINSFATNDILVGATEHVSILEAGRENKVIIPVDENGIINPDVLEKILKQYPSKKLISIMLANNETGVIQDIKTLAKIVHDAGGLLHSDASQAFCKIPVDFKDLECDFMTVSSHKCGGPLGAAALIAKKNIQLTPLIKGGKQELGLRAGTENLLAIAGFGVAASSAEEKIRKFAKIKILRDRIEKELDKAIVIAKEIARLPNTSAIGMRAVKNEEQLIKFDLAGISISAGAACSSGRIATSHVLKTMGIEEAIAQGVIRVSLGLETIEHEIDRFIQLWQEINREGNLR
jgi:cysteine desulfurase